MIISDQEKSAKIKQYWDERANATPADSVQATTYDIFLREHEIATLTEKMAGLSLPAGSTVIDVGCGDGHSTISLAAAFPALRFIGVDWSEEMLGLAAKKAAAHPEPRGTVSFRVADMRRLSAALGTDKFEVFITIRSLINLTSPQEQYDTIAQIAEHLAPGGYYFCIENFMQGQESFNRLRVAMGLPEIPVRWHNLFFDETRYVEELRPYFDSLTFHNFLSSYYLATRIIYSAGCQLAGEEPDYFHPIHRVATRLPPIGDFCPIKLVTMRRKL